MMMHAQFDHICKKKFKTYNLDDVDTIKCDCSMNLGKVVIENAFGSS